MQRWQNKIRALRRFLKGCSKNQLGDKRKKKTFLFTQLDVLDRKAEVTMLSPQELEYKFCLSTQIRKLLHEEELYWLKRSKATNIVKGDDNTKCFHLLAN